MEEYEDIAEDFANMCSKLGGKFDVTELGNGADMFCHLKNMEINYMYTPKDISVISISSNKKVINDVPETEIEIGEPDSVYYDDDREGLVIDSKEMHAFISKYGSVHVMDTPLSDYRAIQAQY